MTGFAMKVAGTGAIVALLAGCASGPSSAPRPVAGVATPARPQPAIRGDLLLGQTAPALIAMFGPPALDLREGVGRKLQFTAPPCVLDAYLYPPASGRGEPVVTHVDARVPDGRDMDRNACAAALRAR